MYFKLDKNDFVYDINGDIMYRIIATEQFKTIDPNTKTMMRNIITIKEGDKGGYVGSEWCLEEILGEDLKPWVFFCAMISIGSILSGASVLGGDSKVYNNSIIEGGNVIVDTTVNNSHIKTKKYICKENRILVSCFANAKSEIINSNITIDNVRIYSSLFANCKAEDKYGNIKLINSDLQGLVVMHNMESKDTILKGDGNTIIPASTIYKSGDEASGTPSGLLVKIKKKMYTHEEAYNLLNESNTDKKGIYTNVNYHPISSI